MSLSKLTRHLVPNGRISQLVVDKGKGSWVWDVEGNKYLDMTSGIGVTSTGHSHPRVVKAIADQAGQIIHAQQNVFLSHTPQLELLKRLTASGEDAMFGPELRDGRFFFVNSGSEAVDNAIKLSRQYTKKTNVIVFQGGFHGRTIGAMSLTSSKTIYRQGFQPLMSGVHTAAFPYCAHCPNPARRPSHSLKGLETRPECCGYYMEQLELMLKTQTHPDETAAIIIEPILGEGGFVVPPTCFLPYLRSLCDKHNILLIADEVQSGVARTGKWWAHQHFNVNPDVVLFAKGIASGVPFAGLAAKREIFDVVPGTFGGTYGGNAVACAAAVATLDVIKEENLLRNATVRGEQLQTGLLEIAKKYPQVVDVRGKGLMIGLELDPSCHGIAGRLVQECGSKGVLVMAAGAYETIRLLPSLTLTKEEADQALTVLEEALAVVTC